MKTKTLFLLLSILALSACDNNTPSDELSTGSDEMLAFGYATTSGETLKDTNYFNGAYKDQSQQTSEVISVDRQIIKNGSLKFSTESMSKTRHSIKAATEATGGYISSENSSNDDYGNNTTIQVRIPFLEFDNFLNHISKNVEKFEERDISTQDVTEEFVDLNARIKSKKQVEQRYVQILKTAKSVKEILEVEAQIGSVREEIERAEGRLNYLKDRTSMSTIIIEYYQPLITEAVNDGNSFFAELGDSLVFGLDILRKLFLGLIKIWPLFILAAIGVFIYRYTNKAAKT